MKDRESLVKECEQVRTKHGPWTAHNVDLGSGVYTIDAGLKYDTIKLRRIIQIIKDLTGGQLQNLRVLDLGVLEGLYTLELGLQQVREAVGIEAREANLQKAEFARQALDLRNARFCKDDVRSVSEEKYGRFDAVLCLGLLYHLDAPDVFEVLEKVSAMCDRFLIIDTHISQEGFEKVDYAGQAYLGRHEAEFKKGLSKTEKEKFSWRAVDNEQSFLLTKKSLCRILVRFGFTSVFECQAPFEYVKPVDRVTLVAVKGRSASLKTFPLEGIGEAQVKRRMVEEGGCFLVRENRLTSAARRAAKTLRSALKRWAARLPDEELF